MRFFLAGAGSAAVAVTAVSGFFGGRPLRLVDPCRTSMARLSRSRSATRSETMWSVVINRRLSHVGRDFSIPELVFCDQITVHVNAG